MSIKKSFSHYALSLSMALLGATSCQQAVAAHSLDDVRRKMASPSATLERVRNISCQAMQHRLARMHKSSMLPAATTPEGMDDFNQFGWLLTPEGKYWYYTAVIKTDVIGNPDDENSYNDKTISGFELTVYNEKCEVQGKVAGDIPLLDDEIRIASVDFCDVLTKKFFNTDNNYEVMVMVNANTPKYVNNVRTYAFSITADGGVQKPLTSMPGMMVHAIDASVDEWSETFYMIFDNEGYANPDGSFTPATGTPADGAVRGQRFTVFKKGGYSGKPSEVAHIDLSDNEASYNDGVPILVQQKNDYLYMAKTGYEKTFFAEPDNYESWELSPDNHFFFQLYRMPLTGYNQKLEEVSTTMIPMEYSTDPDVPFLLYGSGMLDYMDDMRIDDEGNVSYVLVSEAYQLSTDSHVDTYRIYNSDGTLQQTIFEKADNCYNLSDVEGCARQNCFITVDDQGQYDFHFVNMDNFEQVLQLPANYEGNTLTTNMDRVAVGNGTYRYVVRMGSTQENEEGHLCEAISWINTDGTLHHQQLVYLGSNVATAMPNLSANVINPYFINTDDAYEYMFLVYRYTGVSSKTKAELLVVNDRGETVFNLVPDDAQGSLSTVWVSDDDDQSSIIVVTKKPTGNYAAEAYLFPLTKFTGGEGTADNPYLISTVGDLQQIMKQPSAHYRLTDDIDASLLTLKGSKENFTGTLDGNNKCISNLHLAGSNASLLGYITGPAETTDEQQEPQVKDLVFNDVAMHIDGTATTGLLASTSLQNVRLHNIHVHGLHVDGDAFSGSFGGLVGEAASFTTISGCSVNDAQIQLPRATTVGGIAGALKASSVITACAFNGQLTAQDNVGGIAGNSFEYMSMQQCGINNCHVNADITADNTVGGLVGNDNHNQIHQNYVEGSITATGGNKWSGACAGGVIGTLEWLKGEGDCINCNVVNLAAINYQSNGTSTAFQTAHRIVGKTDYNESQEAKDGYLKDNYAISPASPLHDGEIYAGVDGAEGASIALAEATQSFFDALEFRFGSDVSSPWNFDTFLPRLYFEGKTKALLCSASGITVNAGDEFTLTFDNVGGSAADIELAVTGGIVECLSSEAVDNNRLTAVFKALEVGDTEILAKAYDKEKRCAVHVLPAATGIRGPQYGGHLPQLTCSDSYLHCEGQSISLYTLDGRLAATARGSLSLSPLKSGIYVAKAAGQTLKIVVNGR